MMDYTNILREILDENGKNGSGIVKFFKTLEYTFSQRIQAEEDLKSALETISAEDDGLSSKAQEWLRNFDVTIKSSSTERHWTSTKVNEEREKTQALELISAEKEEQHYHNVISNIAMEHDSASDGFRDRTKQRINKRPSSSSSEESLRELDSNKKVKTGFTLNVSFDEYTTVIHAVKSVQKVNESAHTETDPLWWGVLDFREENISPSPELPRAKNFLLTEEIDRLMGMTRSAIQEEKKHLSKSVESFLEALLLSDIFSLRLLAKECGARGVAGVCDLLQKSADRMQGVSDRSVINGHIKNIDVDDEATIYVGKCIENAYTWINCFPGQSQSERTIDMFLIGPCAKTPQTTFTYGKTHSDAGTQTNLVDVIKVSRAQHIELENQIIEQSGRNLLPDSLQKGIASIFIPFFQVIGLRIRFYILFQINGDLYGFWDWASEFLPTKDADLGEVVLLCKRFLVHGNLVERVGRMISVLAKKSKTFKDKIIDAGE